MKRELILLILLCNFLFVPIHASETNIMYKEKINSYSIYDGEAYRWENTREFLFAGFNTGTNNDSEPIANIDVMDDSTASVIHTIVEPYLPMNFRSNPTYNSTGSLLFIEWDIYITRDGVSGNAGFDPFTSEDISFFTNNGHRRYDLISNTTFFSVNLQYYEYQNISEGITEKIKVNAELSTNNLENGRIVRTALHIIKRRSNSDIIFDYSHSIQEVSKIADFFNIIDQPRLAVLYKLSIVFILIFIYIRIVKYIQKHEIKISRKVHQNDVKD